MSRDLKNKRAIITGAGRGIGRAIAIALAERGVDLVLIARSTQQLSETAALCLAFGVKIKSISYDLTQTDGLKELVETSTNFLGGLDILVNNAGASHRSSTESVDLTVWDKVLDLNLRALIHLSSHCISKIKLNNWGAIINVASLSGKHTYKGGGIYNATKHGVVGFTGALFEDVREENIKVCDICPGFVDTEIVSTENLDRSKMIQTKDLAATVLFVLDCPNTVCPTEIILRPQMTPYL